jgi:PAS domain S-box-containing protein
MMKPLRVLIVEDSEDDALLLIRELKKGGYDPEYGRVETAEAMRTALREKSWDVILCDYRLPQFNGLAAIALSKESGIDIPLIIVSGAIGEETAADCMRSGAYDYVMKGNLSRLGPAIERELKEVGSRAQRRRAEEELRESEELFSLFMRHSPVYAFIKEVTPTESRVLQASDNYEQMIGIPGPKMIGRTMVDLFSPEFAAKITADDWAVVSSGNVLRQDEDLNGRNYATIKFPIVRREKTLLAGYTIDITDRKRAEGKLRESLEQVRRAMQTTIQVLVMAVEVKDPYTAGHQRRMTALARTMATEMGLPPEKIEGLRMAGVIHDIGKITLPTELLSKPMKLSAIELSLVREHVRLGYDILKDVESPWPLAEIVLQHHERMNGSGYPRGLKGEEILIEARILGVADVVEAMASHRPYRPALGLEAALEEIEKNRGSLYDADAADECLRVFREKGYQIEGA